MNPEGMTYICGWNPGARLEIIDIHLRLFNERV